MNMEIAAEPSVGRLYVPPVPHDAGVVLGAAMLKSAEAGVSTVLLGSLGPMGASAVVARDLHLATVVRLKP